MADIVHRTKQKKESVATFTQTGPAIQIGLFTLRKLQDGSIWIERFDGEGAQFSAVSFEDMLNLFYEENF